MSCFCRAQIYRKRQEIAHAQDVLDKATDEIRLCQEQETTKFDSQVSVLKGEFEQQMARKNLLASYLK